MQKRKNYSSSHSLSPAQHNNQGSYSSNNLTKQKNQSNNQEFESEIYQYNFRVLSRQPALRNIEKILYNVCFVNLAKYQVNGDYWSYLKVKGPMFVIIDRYSQIKFVILNQVSTENQIIHIQKEMKFQLKKLQTDGYMLNYCIQDSITGKSIYGIWTADKTIQKIWQHLQGYLSNSKENSLKSID